MIPFVESRDFVRLKKCYSYNVPLLLSPMDCARAKGNSIFSYDSLPGYEVTGVPLFPPSPTSPNLVHFLLPRAINLYARLFALVGFYCSCHMNRVYTVQLRITITVEARNNNFIVPGLLHTTIQTKLYSSLILRLISDFHTIPINIYKTINMILKKCSTGMKKKAKK